MTPGFQDTIRRTSRLPDGWSTREVVEDVVQADGLELRRAGISARGPAEEEALGAAAEIDHSPLDRSYYELLERVALLDALSTRVSGYPTRDQEGQATGLCPLQATFPSSGEPERWTYARSNGVALHRSWRNACLRAEWELVERDRVLRSWYGLIRPEPLQLPTGSSLSRTSSYEWHGCAFPHPGDRTFGAGVHVAGVFGFPSRPSAPLAVGFGAREFLDDAVDAAAHEAMQQLAFLWGEPIREEPPAFGPTPLYHIECFQCTSQRAALRRWLDGAHTRHRRDLGLPLDAQVTFVDLTPSWLAGGLCVAKALCPAAIPLLFGDSPFARHLPVDLRAHPIA